MRSTPSKFIRALGIAPSTRGFGFAVMEDGNVLVDWGAKAFKGNKNARCLSSIGNLIVRYQPNLIVLEDCRSAGARRVSRIRDLVKEITSVAEREGIEVTLLKRVQVRSKFFNGGKGTRFLQARILAARFPKELASRMPRQRKIWMNEDSRMDIFDAVALVQSAVSEERIR